MVLVLAAVGIGGLLAWTNKSPKAPDPIVLKVGKYSYTQSEYNKRIAQAKEMKVSEYEARKVLTEAFASRQAADELNVSYPTDQITLNNQAIRNFQLNRADPQVNDYQRDTSYTLLIKSLAVLEMNGSYKVGFVEFPFARYIVGGNDSEWHNIKLINDDIAYAKSQAQQYRQAFTDNKQSIESLADKARADTRLTYGQAGNKSDVFFADVKGNMYSARFSGNAVDPTLMEKIKQAGEGKITEVTTKTWSNSTNLNLPSIQHGIEIDVSYYFIIVQDKTPARPTIEADFNTRKQRYL